MTKISYSLLMLVFLCSCATTHKTENFNETISSFSDSTAHEIRSGVGQSSINIDSLLQSYLQQSTERQVNRDSTHEQITEAITSYIDSLGREVRTEQRTINRTASSERELFYRQQLARMQQKYAIQQEHHDSLAQSLYESKQSLKTDSISSAATKEVSRKNPFSFLDTLLRLVTTVLMVMIFIKFYRILRKM